MACNLTRGRLVDCKDVIGGIKTIYFTESYCSDVRAKATFGSGDTANTITAGGFENWDIVSAGKVNVMKYDLRPDLSSVTINLQSDPATGTTFFEQTLALTLQKQTAADSNQMRLIAYNRPQIFVLDTNNNIYLLGMDNGMDMTSGTVVSGAAKGDMPGYTFGFVGKEKEAQIWLPAAGAEGATLFPFDGLSDEDKINIVLGT
tara:strand:- start:11475 stop:12083 length:609 start_codon:yes stop_codon:yes gene_type:complete